MIYSLFLLQTSSKTLTTALALWVHMCSQSVGVIYCCMSAGVDPRWGQRGAK